MRNRPVLAILLLSSLALADGRWSAVGATRDKISLGEHRLTGRLDDRIAQLTLEQEFSSAASREVEVHYEFELPADAAVTSFAMTMNGEWVDGRVLDRNTAKKTYEKIVAKRRDPGLLERTGEGRYRARVFPLPAGGSVRIRVGFQLVLPAAEGAVRLRLPAPTGAPSGCSGDIVVKSPREIVQVASRTHALEVDREIEDGVRVVWNGGPGRFSMRYRDQRDQVTFTLLSHRRSGEKGTFLAILQPPVSVKDEEVLPKDVVFVLDESGSMGGDKMREAKAALRAGIERLRDGDRFNVIAFSTSVTRFREGLVPAGERTRADAAAWIDGRKASGGTALDAALQAALEFGDRDRLGLVALLTDGLPTVGPRDPSAIVGRLQHANRHDHRVFVFGVGLDQDARFLDRVAHVTRAAREDVTDADDVVPAMTRFYRRVERPVLTGLRLAADAGLSSVQPHPLPDLFAGDEVVVTGRYGNSGAVAFRLSGRVRGREVEHVFEGTLTDREELACLPRFWAKRQVDVLVAALAAGGDRGELVPAIRELGTRYSLVTPFTAGLVVERDAPVATARRGGAGETPIETVEVDTDARFGKSSGAGGMRDTPFTGPSTNAAIGMGGGAGGGRRRTGNAVRISAEPVARGLSRLAERQNADGTFSSVRETASAVLAFLAAGYTDRGSAEQNPHAAAVRMGLRALMNAQEENGRLGDDAATHARAAAALCGAYALTRNPRYKRPAQKALDYIARIRGKHAAWPAKKPEIVLTARMVVALKAGKHAGLEVDPDAFDGARKVLNDANGVKTDADAAAALVARMQLGETWADNERLEALARRVRDAKDAGDLACLALFQAGGKAWKPWIRARAEALRDAQRADGSWGSIEETARACLELAIAYRYNHIFR